MLENDLPNAAELKESLSKTASVIAIGGFLGGLYSMYYHKSVILGIGIGGVAFFILSKLIVKQS